MKKTKWTACYVRVSTYDQHKGLASQRRALSEYVRNHGLQQAKFYTDTISGVTTSRPGFDKLQQRIFEGKVHTVIVWKLDRISRKGIKEGINILTGWLDKGIRVVSVTQQLDFAGPTGQLVASVMFALAAMERENLRENTKRGLVAAKARGVKLGKRPKLFSKDIVPMLKEGKSIAEIAEHFGKTRQAIYAALRREGFGCDGEEKETQKAVHQKRVGRKRKAGRGRVQE